LPVTVFDFIQLAGFTSLIQGSLKVGNNNGIGVRAERQLHGRFTEHQHRLEDGFYVIHNLQSGLGHSYVLVDCSDAQKGSFASFQVSSSPVRYQKSEANRSSVPDTTTLSSAGFMYSYGFLCVC